MHSIKTYMILLLTISVLAGCGSRKVYKQSTINSKPYAAPKIDDSIKYKYLTAINTFRSQGRSCGTAGYFSDAPALRWNDSLYRASYEHSRDMMQSNSLSHKGSQSTFDWTAKAQSLSRASSFKDRIENNGYTKWKNIAENIAMGSSTVDQVMDQWISSDGHCANIMNPQFTDVGMAEVNKYWTQDFSAHQ